MGFLQRAERFLSRGKKATETRPRQPERKGKMVNVTANPQELLDRIEGQQITDGFNSEGLARQLHYFSTQELQNTLDRANEAMVTSSALEKYKRTVQKEIDIRKKEEATAIGRIKKLVRDTIPLYTLEKRSFAQDRRNLKNVFDRARGAIRRSRQEGNSTTPKVETTEEFNAHRLQFIQLVTRYTSAMEQLGREITEVEAEIEPFDEYDSQEFRDLMDELSQLERLRSDMRLRYNELAAAYYAHDNDLVALRKDARWENFAKLAEEISLIENRANLEVLPHEIERVDTDFDDEDYDYYHIDDFTGEYAVEARKSVEDPVDSALVAISNLDVESFYSPVDQADLNLHYTVRNRLVDLRQDALRELHTLQQNNRPPTSSEYLRMVHEIRNLVDQVTVSAKEEILLTDFTGAYYQEAVNAIDIPAYDAVQAINDRLQELENGLTGFSEEQARLTNTRNKITYLRELALQELKELQDRGVFDVATRDILSELPGREVYQDALNSLQNAIDNAYLITRNSSEQFDWSSGDLLAGSEDQQEFLAAVEKIEQDAARDDFLSEVAGAQKEAVLEVVKEVNAKVPFKDRARALFAALRKDPQVRDALIVTGVQVVAGATGGMSTVATAAGAPFYIGLQERRIRSMDEDQLQEHVVDTYSRMTRDYAETWSQDEKNVILRHVKAAAGLGMNALKFVADIQAKVLIGVDRSRTKVSQLSEAILIETGRESFDYATVEDWLQKKIDAAFKSGDPNFAAGALEQLSDLYTRLNDVLVFRDVNTPAPLGRRLTDSIKKTAWGKLLSGEGVDPGTINYDELQSIVNGLHENMMRKLNDRKVINDILWKASGRAQDRLSRAMQNILEKTENPKYGFERLRKMSRNMYLSQLTGAATNAFMMDTLSGRLPERVGEFESQYADIVNDVMRQSSETPPVAQTATEISPRFNEFESTRNVARAVQADRVADSVPAPSAPELPTVPESSLPEFELPNPLESSAPDYQSAYEASLIRRGIQVPEGTISLDGDGALAMIGEKSAFVRDQVESLRGDWPEFNRLLTQAAERKLSAQYLEVVNDAMTALHRTLTPEEYRALAVEVANNIVPDGTTTTIEKFALNIGNRKDLLTQMGIGQ